MAASPPNCIQVDHLAILPDDLLSSILWLLPTHIAARTAILAHRFRHLWEASPSLHFTCFYTGRSRYQYLSAIADRTLFRRNYRQSLLSLRLDLGSWGYSSKDGPMVGSVVFSLVFKALSLGIRHLAIDDLNSSWFAATVPIIFSSNTLQSLSLGLLPHQHFPSGITLTCLTSLSLTLCQTDPGQLSQFLSELPSLENLCLQVRSIDKIEICSKTITQLKLVVDNYHHPTVNSVTLFIPSFSLHIEINGYRASSFIVPYFRGEVPLLTRADISLDNLSAQHVNNLMGLLKFISHVEQLVLHVKEDIETPEYPVPVLFKPEEDMLSFSNLKYLNVTACFHNHNLEAIITMLHHSPALESLNLVHEIPNFSWDATERKKELWRSSKLPFNADGNYCFAYYRNLHLGENRIELINLMSKKLSCKMQAYK